VIPVRLVVLACLLAFLPGTSSAGLRVWSFTSGQTLTAEFRWVDRETLYLRDPKGKDLKMPVGLLANADLEFVRAIRDRLYADGIVYEAPLRWESYHSKNVRPLDAERAGHYPLDSRENAMGKLELEFERVGLPPELGPGKQAVLRLTTSRQENAGTNSPVQVGHQRRVIGSRSGIPRDSTFDIPLAPTVFGGTGPVTLTVTCGTDTIYVRTGKSGTGPRLLILENKPN
jgi:hypothetical protein